MKPDEAKEILAALGMPRAQQNLNAAYTLLAFANVGPETPWAQATSPRRTPHEIITFIFDAYGKRYAENTRETIRRQAIHQFVQGGVLVRNPDAPGLATNSPRTHYALTKEALEIVRAYGHSDFEELTARFRLAQGGGLAKKYARARRDAAVTVVLPDGDELVLSPGAHNALQAAIIHDFLPRFARGARVLYLGDTDLKTKLVAEADLASLGIAITRHDKLPDVVLYDAQQNWLFLIEAVTSHGPVSAKRHHEGEKNEFSLDWGVFEDLCRGLRQLEKPVDISKVMAQVERLLDESIDASGYELRERTEGVYAGRVHLGSIDFAALQQWMATTKHAATAAQETEVSTGLSSRGFVGMAASVNPARRRAVGRTRSASADFPANSKRLVTTPATP